MEFKTRREKFEVMRSQLANERSSFLSHWRELGDHTLPRRMRFQVNDVNKGDRRSQKIIDSTASMAVRTLRSGMMSGVTSPARPWFRLTVKDPKLAEAQRVKEWLHQISQEMGSVFLKSNLYNALPILYGDIGIFATSALYVEEDLEEVVRFTPIPIGSYYISVNEKLKVDTFIREFRMTVRQILEKFGNRKPDGSYIWDNLSIAVKTAYETGNLETWIDVVHIICPNDQFNPNRLSAKHKRYASCYYEQGTQTSNGQTSPDLQDKYLRESGYDFFPVLCPRWEVTGEDSYGTDCPAMLALGDIKQVQLGEKRIAQAIEKSINPPMTGPTSLKSAKATILPADITYLDVSDPRLGFRPAHEINPRIQEMEGKQEQIRTRIRRAFFEDLFLMLASSDRRQITAREIEERHEEKLLALGPVLEQLNQDLLDPLIDITFDLMVQQRRIPEPPPELEGMPLTVEYISVMAQAQKMVGIGSMDRFVGFVTNVAAVDQRVLDKANTDQWIDIYADMCSVPPTAVRSDEDAEAIRAQARQAQAAAQEAEMIKTGASAAKDLSQTSLEDDSALTAMINAGNITGVA